MEVKDYLAYIVNEIHTTVVATVDEDGLPYTCAIDMMYADDNSLYFLTAKGKSLYDRLVNKGFIAFTAMKGDDTMSTVAVSVRGKIRELGYEKIPYLFEKNSYMNEIYPTEASRRALTVFQIYEGSGEWFDLSKKPIERAVFTFGDVSFEEEGYFISDSCIGCGACLNICPQSCIDLSVTPAVIQQGHCIHCGNCENICPVSAVERRGRN